MSPAPRRRPGDYRPPRDRREIAVAVLAALGVLLVTAALLFVLRPRDESSDVPPVTAPLPTESSTPPDPSAPPVVPPETLPPETTPAPVP
ncbi:MAG: hypothetical protein ACRDY4_02910 [Acidimicrobiia bacterium]